MLIEAADIAPNNQTGRKDVCVLNGNTHGSYRSVWSFLLRPTALCLASQSHTDALTQTEHLFFHSLQLRPKKKQNEMNTNRAEQSFPQTRCPFPPVGSVRALRQHWNLQSLISCLLPCPLLLNLTIYSLTWEETGSTKFKSLCKVLSWPPACGQCCIVAVWLRSLSRMHDGWRIKQERL